MAERIRVELGLVRCPRGAIKAHDANNLAVSRHSSGVELDLRRGSSCIPLEHSQHRLKCVCKLFSIGVSVKCKSTQKAVLENQPHNVAPGDEATDSAYGFAICR